MLSDNIRRILKEFPVAQQEPFKNHPIAKYLRNDIPRIFYSLLNELPNQDEYLVKASPGKGGWTVCPWIAILNKNITKTTQKGYYLVFLFKSDFTGVYLSLNQGVTTIKDDPNRKLSPTTVLRNRAVEYRELLGDEYTELMTDINLEVEAGTPKLYEPGNIYGIYYDKNNLPDDVKLKDDFLRIMTAYNELHSRLLERQDPPPDPNGTGSEDVPPTPDDSSKSADFFGYLSKRGFQYDMHLVENFLLSLKVKPFVILTGNSGTGKTKLAQLFSQYLESEQITKPPFIDTLVKVGKSSQSGGWNFKKEDFFDRYPLLKKYERDYSIELNGVKSKGHLTLMPRLIYDPSDTEIQHMLDRLTQDNPEQKINLKIFTSKTPSALSGKNHTIIPVGANWTENRHIVGFYNLIHKNYQGTKALDLILESRKAANKPKPYFLILDEMNLSHVERYFADFLSSMESGESIPLHNQGDCTDVPPDLKIPLNLFVVGTVNVDETTYMFSPKVLDRANTIEFRTTPVSTFLSPRKEKKSPSGNITYLENPLSDPELRTCSIEFLRSELANVMLAEAPTALKLWDVLSAEMELFQEALKKAGFDFGYRVAIEITRFIYVAWKYERGAWEVPVEWDNFERYFDAQIMQKMLPKIHGSTKTLGDVLPELLKLCFKKEHRKDELEKAPWEYLKDFESEKGKYRYPESARKIMEMADILFKQRYVSFTR